MSEAQKAEKLKEDMGSFLNSYVTMRKYQVRFFSGDKSALRMAKYHESNCDNLAKKIEVEHKIKVTVTDVKGPSGSAGSLSAAGAL